MEQILLNVLWAFLTAVAVSLILTPIVKKIAPLIGAIDVPKDERRMHTKAMPLCGGLAMFAAFSIASFLFFPISNQFWGIWLGILLTVMIGVLDDIISLHAYIKFAAQFITASVPLFFGVSIEEINLFGNVINLGIFSIPLTVIWIVALTNAYNLIDGLDGLAGGTSAVSALTLFAVGIITTNVHLMILSAVLFGACLGFLPYNFNPAKIFMGDTGAMFLGYTLACLSILGFYSFPANNSAVIPFLICGFPVFDTISVFVRRIGEGKSPFFADRGHTHHKLIDRGFNQRQAVLFLHTVSALLGIIAITLCLMPNLISSITLCVLAVGGIIFLVIKKLLKNK